MVKDGFVVAEKYKARFEELGKASNSLLLLSSFSVSLSTLTLNADGFCNADIGRRLAR